MKKIKRIIAVLAVSVLAGAFAFSNAEKVFANAGRIVINGTQFNNTQPIVNINDRFLVPFREIGEAIGAEVDWDQATQTVSMYRGNLYSYMQVGNTIMRHGVFRIDQTTGEKIYVSEFFATLVVAPVLINNFTYIPVRGLEQSLGTVVTWEAATATAFITTQAVGDPNAPPTVGNNNNNNANNNQTTPTAPNFGDFSNISHFRFISSETARVMFEDAHNYPFIFVLYDSSLHESRNLVPNIMVEAANIRTRIYGVDISGANFTRGDMSFLWSVFPENQAVEPTIYFVNNRRQIEQIQRPTDMAALRTRIQQFTTQAEVTHAIGNFSDTTFFRNRTASQIGNMYEDNLEFMLFLYDSTNERSRIAISIVKTAAHNAQQLVYGLDVSQNAGFQNRVDFLSAHGNVANQLPLIFTVYEGRLNFDEFRTPVNVAEMTRHIEEFRILARNQGAFSDFTGNWFTNGNILSVNALASTSNSSFMMLVYDSRSFNQTDVETVLSVMNEINIRNLFSYVALNEFSTVFEQNRNRNNYQPWFTNVITNNTQRPVLVYVRNGVIVAHTTNLSTPQQVRNFINSTHNHWN
ncbi:MAG: copper amine oxidase N-terminal domain-containing protein [Defluviitaleaceae bacterium]|nr:copper amine oxidase N-terminal domain-containing protein [Defluviitaleaceae bacterium]